MKTLQISCDEFAAFADNPRQRDTVRHAIKAAKGHLSKLEDPHTVVHAARLPNGKMVKVDGHTRSLMWSDGRLKRPSLVTCIAYDVKSLKEAENLYSMFDSSMSLETPKDKVAGAFRSIGFTPESSALKAGPVKSAMFLLSPYESIYESISNWKQCLEILDSTMATHKTFTAGMMAGALALIRMYANDSKKLGRLIAFFDAIKHNTGTKTEQGSDGADAIARYKLSKVNGGGSILSHDHASKMITCGEAWVNGRRIVAGVRPTNFESYLKHAMDREMP